MRSQVTAESEIVIKQCQRKSRSERLSDAEEVCIEKGDFRRRL